MKKGACIMKKFAAGTLFAVLALAGSGRLASAATPYATGSVGLAMLQDSDVEFAADRSYNTGYTLTGAVGLRSGEYRLEGELGYQENGIESSGDDVSILSFLGNGYIDFEMASSSFTPYLTAGFGLASVDDSSGPGSVDDTVFAWQLGAGVGYRFADNMLVDVRYRYLGTGDPELAGGREYSIDTHNFMVGLRVEF
ncbi:outer surface protein, putative [Pelodictyon luteolum DSM 273]|uniref:Outer surface protein, putative n=2 Tax=Pelodictyon luteolum TaxID=1100 RepID=Q3B641_CHLL3|nr:outer surface protein, putative [Pelodictyon luteolum DSM 273]